MINKFKDWYNHPHRTWNTCLKSMLGYNCRGRKYDDGTMECD